MRTTEFIPGEYHVFVVGKSQQNRNGEYVFELKSLAELFRLLGLDESFEVTNRVGGDNDWPGRIEIWPKT